jgi:hypothetical protein
MRLTFRPVTDRSATCTTLRLEDGLYDRIEDQGPGKLQDTSVFACRFVVWPRWNRTEKL